MSTARFCVQRFAPSLTEESSDVIVVESAPVSDKRKSVPGSCQDNELEKKDSHGHNPGGWVNPLWGISFNYYVLTWVMPPLL